MGSHLSPRRIDSRAASIFVCDQSSARLPKRSLYLQLSKEAKIFRVLTRESLPWRSNSHSKALGSGRFLRGGRTTGEEGRRESSVLHCSRPSDRKERLNGNRNHQSDESFEEHLRPVWRLWWPVCSRDFDVCPRGTRARIREGEAGQKVPAAA